MEVIVHMHNQLSKDSISQNLSALYLRVAERLLKESLLSTEDKLKLLQEFK